jgi:hypothetical protein
VYRGGTRLSSTVSRCPPLASRHPRPELCTWGTPGRSS